MAFFYNFEQTLAYSSHAKMKFLPRLTTMTWVMEVTFDLRLVLPDQNLLVKVSEDKQVRLLRDTPKNKKVVSKTIKIVYLVVY